MGVTISHALTDSEIRKLTQEILLPRMEVKELKNQPQALRFPISICQDTLNTLKPQLEAKTVSGVFTFEPTEIISTVLRDQVKEMLKTASKPDQKKPGATVAKATKPSVGKALKAKCDNENGNNVPGEKETIPGSSIEKKEAVAGSPIEKNAESPTSKTKTKSQSKGTKDKIVKSVSDSNQSSTKREKVGLPPVPKLIRPEAKLKAKPPQSVQSVKPTELDPKPKPTVGGTSNSSANEPKAKPPKVSAPSVPKKLPASVTKKVSGSIGKKVSILGKSGSVLPSADSASNMQGLKAADSVSKMEEPEVAESVSTMQESEAASGLETPNDVNGESETIVDQHSVEVSFAPSVEASELDLDYKYDLMKMSQECIAIESEATSNSNINQSKSKASLHSVMKELSESGNSDTILLQAASSLYFVNQVKGFSGLEILRNVIGESEATENKHPVEISAAFKMEDETFIEFKYKYDPTTKTQDFDRIGNNETLAKVGIAIDENGNLDADQFLKTLPNLVNTYEGIITLNSYKITTDKDTTRRLKLASLDTTCHPILLTFSANEIKTVKAIKSSTKLDVQGETGVDGDDFKWIRFEGQNARQIKLVSPPETEGTLYITIPAN